jgi:hypothetical protein
MSQVPRASTRNRLLVLAGLAVLGSGLIAVGLVSSRGAHPEGAPIAEANPAWRCEDVTWAWLWDITHGYATIDDARFEFGSLSPQYDIIVEAWQRFNARAGLVGEDRATQEVYDEVIVPRCEEEYGAASGVGADEGGGYDGV